MKTQSFDFDTRPSTYGLSINEAIAQHKKDGLAKIMAGESEWTIRRHAREAERAMAEGRSFTLAQSISAYVVARFDAADARWSAAYDACRAEETEANWDALRAAGRSASAVHGAITRQFGIKF